MNLHAQFNKGSKKLKRETKRLLTIVFSWVVFFSFLVAVNGVFQTANYLVNRDVQVNRSAAQEIERLKQDNKHKEEQIQSLRVIVQARLQKKEESISDSIKAETYLQPVEQREQPVVVASIASGDVRSMIITAAGKYGVSADWLLRVGNCESGYNPGAVNHTYYAGGGNPSGVFQFLPQTWASMSSQAGFGGYSVFNAYANVNVAAWAFSHGHANQWECK